MTDSVDVIVRREISNISPMRISQTVRAVGLSLCILWLCIGTVCHHPSPLGRRNSGLVAYCYLLMRGETERRSGRGGEGGGGRRRRRVLLVDGRWRMKQTNAMENGWKAETDKQLIGRYSNGG